MKKLEKKILIPAIGAALAASLVLAGACGGGKKASLTLDAGGGGALSETEYSVKTGSDLYDFLADKQPAVNEELAKEGVAFAGWYDGADLIEEGDTMPAEGLSLTAKYSAPYRIDVYTREYAEAEAVLSTEYSAEGRGIWQEPMSILEGFQVPNGYELVEDPESVSSTDKLVPGFTFKLYLTLRDFSVSFRSNAPDGVEIGGNMPSQAVGYGKSFTVPAPAFDTPDNVRFAGWTVGQSGGEKCYFEGDTIENVTESFSLFANWDRGYRDLGGGSDVIFLPSAREGVALLVREGLGEKEGTFHEATHIFTFELPDGDTLTGRITDWDRYTFTYEQTGGQVSYGYCDAYSGEKDGEITLVLDTFDGAVFTDPEGKLFQGVQGRVEGVYSLYGTIGGEALYAFLSKSGSFLFKLGEREDDFYIQGPEAGEYALLTDAGVDDYYVLVLDGFGNVLYEVYSEGWTTQSGRYSALENGECALELGGNSFKCLLVLLEDGTAAFLRADTSLETDLTSKDGKSSIHIDAYGDLGYATVREDGGSRTYAKYWDVFGFRAGGTETLVRYLRCIDEYTGQILRTFRVYDDSTYEEVGPEAGQYFQFDLISSSMGLCFLTLDGVEKEDSMGSWTLYSFAEDEHGNIDASPLAGGVYREENGDIILTRTGNADEAAPAPFQNNTVSVMFLGLSVNGTSVSAFVAEETKNEATLSSAETGNRSTIKIDGFGIATYAMADGATYVGTFTLSDYDDLPPFENADEDKDAVLTFTDRSSGQGVVFNFYLPDGLGDGGLFYPMGDEAGTYEGGNNETYGMWIRLSGFAGDDEGYACFGTESGSAAGGAYVLDGVYFKAKEEYYGIVWQFNGKTWRDDIEFVGTPATRPDSVTFQFVLDEIVGWPVFRIYDENDEAEYRGPNGEILIVTGVRTAQFTDAAGRRWTGDAQRSEDLDFFGNHIADTVIFEYTGTDGGLYEFTFRVDDATGTFLIQGAEVGNYYQIDALKREVNTALRLALDGYGGATLFVPNAVTPDRPETGTILVTGSYEETEDGIFRFTPDLTHENAAEYPTFTFTCSEYTESSSRQNVSYAVYYAYLERRDGVFVNSDWSVLSLNGYDTAVWIDARGRRREGQFASLGQNVVRLTAGGETVYFLTDRAARTFSRYEGDFVVEGDVLLAYAGSSVNVVISDPDVKKIGRGAFIDAQIASIDLGGVTEIGDRAFDGSTLSSVTGGENVGRIGDQAFLYCDNLTAASFPKATYVGRQAFAFCYSLAELTLGEVTEIGDRAFESCFTDPLETAPAGTFRLILGNKTSAPDLGGIGVFGIYYSGGTFRSDIDFTVRVQSLAALKAFYVHKAWINGSKGYTGLTNIPVGDTFNRNVYFAEAGEEGGAWYAADTLERIFLDGLVSVNGRYFGAYECKNGAITVYSYTDPSEGHEGNFTTSAATLADGTLSGAFGGTERTFRHEGETLTYENGEQGTFSVVLGRQFPLLGTYKGEKGLVRTEGGRAELTVGLRRYLLTLGEGTYEVEEAPVRFDEFIEGANGSSVRITQDESGNVSMRNGSFVGVNGQNILFDTAECGWLGENVYYFDTAIGTIPGEIWRVSISISAELDEEALAYRYSFTYEGERYLTLKEAPSQDTDRTVFFGYDDKGTLQDMWIRFTAPGSAAGVRTYFAKGDWHEEGGDYLFFVVDGYDPAEGLTFRIKPSKDAGGNITSVTIEDYILEVDFEGEAADGSTVHIVSQKDAGGNFVVTVEGEFKDVEGQTFRATIARRAEYLSGSVFAVYTDKSIDGTAYYRIRISVDLLEGTFEYTCERAGKAVKTVINDTYTVWVYASVDNFKSDTWFFVQIDETVGGVTTTLEGKAIYENAYPYNVTFTVPTEKYGDRIFRFRIGYGLNVTDFKAM